MAYTKVVQSGDLVEQWTYEREPAALSGGKRKPRVKRVFARERRADNVQRVRKSFTRLVRANLSGDSSPALLTLTTEANTGISEGYRLYTRFADRLRRQYGSLIRFIAVPEFQRRGAVHFHVLVWGLPDHAPCRLSRSWYIDKTGKKHRTHVCPKERECERRTRRIADLWGNGFVDLVETDGNAKLAAYLAKYMSKAMHDKRLLGKRAYSASRNVLRPVSLNTSFQILLAKEGWGITGDSTIAKQKEYDTMFLGRCVYTSYLIEHESKEH